MCVCASIRPSKPVYLERSMISAPGGIADASVVTARNSPASTMTIAFVQTLPLASHSLPKRTALMFFAPAFSWAKPRVDPNISRTTRAIRTNRMSIRLQRAVEDVDAQVRVLIQFWMECKRDSPRVGTNFRISRRLAQEEAIRYLEF